MLRAALVATELLRDSIVVEASKAELTETRKEVEKGWLAVREMLVASGQDELAERVRRFAATMSPVIAERESIAKDLQSRIHFRQPGTR
jgi:hypothetical protein